MSHRLTILTVMLAALSGCCKGNPSGEPQGVDAAAVPAPGPATEQPSPPSPAPAPSPVPEPQPAAEGASPYKAEDLKGRLADLNDLCGDVWCEGVYDYTFTDLACEKKNMCVLSFKARNTDNGKTYQDKVDLSGFTDVVPDEDGGFDEAVGEALEKWEKSPKT